eukprot:6375390-Prymnesium_polylepis.1
MSARPGCGASNMASTAAPTNMPTRSSSCGLEVGAPELHQRLRAPWQGMRCVDSFWQASAASFTAATPV